MKKLFVILLVVLSSVTIYAQQTGPQISWKTSTYDFGTINEEDGLQTAKFEFINTGNEALYITNVKPACGCTAADFSKEPVQAGETGYVIATYNAKGRPGKFNKSITVTTNEFQPTSIIRIMGEVIAKPKQDVEADTKSENKAEGKN